jgi:1-acyl-sn-glycerol-3-phosphate acyltransferase
LFPDDGPVGKRVFRRVRGIVLEIVAFVLITVLFPVLIVGAAVVDLVLWVRNRKHWMGTRLVAMGWWFLAGEMFALAGLTFIWVTTGGPFGEGSLRRRRMLYGLRLRWTGWILGGIRRIFGLRFELDGLDQGGPGPVMIFIRHASIIDNMLGDAVIARAHGLGLRYVIKRELQMIPVIDIGGRWVPTNYLRRVSDDAPGEIAKLASLADDIGADEGILIYPEGTRATKKKIARAKEIVAERQPELAERANRLEHLLPPRTGGPLALLERDGGKTDVVICGHTGFDGFQYVSDVWAGGLVGSTIHMRLRRFPAAEIPRGEQGRTDWLYERWLELDEWVGGMLAAEGEETPVD